LRVRQFTRFRSAPPARWRRNRLSLALQCAPLLAESRQPWFAESRCAVTATHRAVRCRRFRAIVESFSV